MRTAITLLFLLSTLLASEEIDNVYDEPEVEPSALERHQGGTHEAGQQYDFVSDAVDRQGSSGGSGEERGLHDQLESDAHGLLNKIFGRGDGIRPVNLDEDRSEGNNLIEALKKLSEGLEARSKELLADIKHARAKPSAGCCGAPTCCFCCSFA